MDAGTKKKRAFGVIAQVILLFIIITVCTGLLTFITQRRRSDNRVTVQMERVAREVARETSEAVTDYPAHDWLVNYWYRNSESLDIEYDVEYAKGTETYDKCNALSERHPSLQLQFAEPGDIADMTGADQKLYAEVVYNWVITRLNEIKDSWNVDYLFLVLTDPDCGEQFFLLSAGGEGMERGTEYEQVYPLGTTVNVTQEQSWAMQQALEKNEHFAPAGKYVDFYTYFGEVDGLHALVGLTYNLTGIRNSIRTDAMTGTLFASGYQVLVAVASLILIVLFFLRPLQKVQMNIRRYMHNKDSAQVVKSLAKIWVPNEIGDLSMDVSDLTLEIDDYLKRIKSITAEKERIKADIELASEIQSAMLPHTFPPFPERSEFDIFASMDPARGVGGDFYNYFFIDDDHLCLMIADVSGKGIPAALFMVVCKTALESSAMAGISPAEILARSNESLCGNNQQNMFVTVWLGILEISTGKLRASSAGHEYPAIREVGGEFTLLKDKHGIALGCIEDAEYTEYELDMKPGSELFVYTDGVPEAADEAGNMFGTGRMIDALNSDPDAGAEVLLRQVRASVDNFVNEAEQFDDLTMLCIRYNGKTDL